jgi:RND superfamily putative drug exporter
MSFLAFGNSLTRWWPFLPVVWGGLVIALSAVAPATRDVITDGDFKFLPRASPSRVGERVFAAHFEGAVRGSNIVVIARRAGRGEKLTDEDRQFVEEVLAPRIRAVADETGWSRPDRGGSLVAEVSTSGTDKAIGPLLDSRDGAATLVRISLTTELTERKNDPLIADLRKLIDPVAGELHKGGLVPAGLELYLTGPPVIGRDMRMAAAASARATEKATVLLVIVLLILIYRAPLLALIPLVTVAIVVKIALSVLAMLADAGYVTLFHGCEIYVTVVTYGAGIDYCMFLMARYKEELDSGASLDEAIAGSISGVGGALTASAATVIVGIGMMVFAEFGRFRQAGIAMSFSLFIVLIASLTLAPALLRLFGKYAFWPRVLREQRAGNPAVTPVGRFDRLLGGRRLDIWEDLASAIVRRPGLWWMGSAAVMLPLVIVGILFFDRTTYGLLTELPPGSPSVLGTGAVQEHFPAGETGPVTVLVATKGVSFSEPSGSVVAGELTDALWGRRKELGIADIRSQADPYGKSRAHEGGSIFARRLQRHAATRHYVSNQGPQAGHITRLDVIFHEDPFSSGSLDQLDRLKAAVREVLPPELHDAQTYYIGATASIHDLKAVTGRDQIRIDLMVLGGVFAVLVALLRQIMVAAYLIFTVFFSFLATLGVTIAAFWALNPDEFVGLDWKVPIFLFTILVAIGEDYNIYLVARIDEEQRRAGGVAGVREGLARTGGIISSCGIIMAGTFCSLMFGSLAGMVQLGFALAFGVVLDTFVVRPILVPAYLVMLNDGRFGSASRFFGAYVPDQGN